MPTKLQHKISSLLGNYWFVPTAMSIAAILLSFATTLLDGWLGSAWMHNIQWLWSNKPDGAREVLSTLAGSMITVGGVTFSVTIASVAYTSSQFAPRLLSNFMQDRGNQLTLGTFVATFLYCLLVLRTVRSSGDQAAGEQIAFVPHISIFVAVVLAVVSVGVLIYFMHHIPESIHVSNVVASIGGDLLGHIQQRAPSRHSAGISERDAGKLDSPDATFKRESLGIQAETNGYVQHLDVQGLIDTAAHHGLVVEVLARPGDYVMSSENLLLAHPAQEVEPAVAERLRCCFILGGRRTPTSDPMFLVNELAQIAARALSPGVNDPFTAISCLHWLKSAVAQMAIAAPQRARHYDEQSTLRVITHPFTFHEFTEAAFVQLRPYAATDRNASLAYCQCLKDLMTVTVTDEQRGELARVAQALRDDVHRSLSEQDCQEVHRAVTDIIRLQDDPQQRQRYMRETHYSDGSG